MTGQFSVAPLEKLLSSGVNVCAVVVPAAQPLSASMPRPVTPNASLSSDLPLVDPFIEHNIIHLSWAHNVPVWEVDSLQTERTLALLAEMQPDLIAVACFPFIFPAALLDLPAHGCVNLHPSLLPAYRGPEPLFWIARNDERETGVTLHFLDAGVDTGDIVSQISFERPEGISGAELEMRCAEAGAKLLLKAVHRLEQGPLPRYPQPEAGASYFSTPREEDFVIPTHWPAQRAFNFLRGAESWPLVIDTGDTQFPIRVAISYSANQTIEQPYILLGNELWVQFQPGVLYAKL